MSSDTVISVENLGKKYRIRHQAERQRYVALRDVLADAAKAPARRIWSATRRLFGRNGHPTSDIRLPVPLSGSQLSRSPVVSGPRTEEFWALRDVSFSVRRGEVVGIIGRNGAGKSTLLKILSRITEPTEGLVRIKGRVASLLEVGTGFHPELTGRENIFLNGAILGMAKAEIRSKFDEIVAFAEVEKFLDTPVKRYSSGMYVRLAFAVAAHLEPEILIVDEVLAVGDTQFQKKCIGKMNEVAKGGRTVLFVSHNMAAVAHLCRQCMVLNCCSLYFTGQPRDAIAAYLDLSKPQETHHSPGYVYLAHRVNPCLDHPPLIRAIRLLNDKQQSTQHFEMGSALSMEIFVSGLTGFSEAHVGVMIRSALNQRVCSINTGMTCDHLNSERCPTEKATLHIPKIYLVPGRYSIDLSVAQKSSGRIDYVEEAIDFNVIGADVYGSGYEVHNGFGVFYLDGKWTIENAQNESPPVEQRTKPSPTSLQSSN